MMDLIAAVALGTVSALVVFVYLHFPAWRDGQRATVGSVFATWFALVVTIGATGMLGGQRGVGPAGLGVAVVLPFVMLWYFSMRPGVLRDALRAIPMPVLIGVHAVRVLGIFFVLLFWGGRLPAPFAPAAGWGDVLIGVTALPVAYIAATKAPGWRVVTLAWSALGLLDLADAIFLGAASAPGMPLGLVTQGRSSDLMTALPWILIPCFNVPILAHLHILVFQRLSHAYAATGQSGHIPRHSS
jgi:hypothetical protein